MACLSKKKVVDYSAFIISEEALKAVDLRIVFATALDKHEDPVNNLTTFDLFADGEIITYISWFDLKAGEQYYIKHRWLDPSGNVFEQQDLLSKPDEPTAYTYFTLTTRDGVTPKGTITAQIFLNNHLVRQQKFTIR
jgi:hypothetical protein